MAAGWWRLGLFPPFLSPVTARLVKIEDRRCAVNNRNYVRFLYAVTTTYSWFRCDGTCFRTRWLSGVQEPDMFTCLCFCFADLSRCFRRVHNYQFIPYCRQVAIPRRGRRFILTFGFVDFPFLFYYSHSFVCFLSWPTFNSTWNVFFFSVVCDNIRFFLSFFLIINLYIVEFFVLFAKTTTVWNCNHSFILGY